MDWSWLILALPRSKQKTPLNELVTVSASYEALDIQTMGSVSSEVETKPIRIGQWPNIKRKKKVKKRTSLRLEK